MQRIKFKTQRTILLLVSLFWACAAGDGRTGPPAQNPAHYKATAAVAMTPQNFPNHTIGDVKDAFRLVKNLGDHTVFIYQWSHLDFKVAKLILDMSRDAQLIPILALSPTTLDQGRKELDLPADTRRRAGAAISFANPVIRRAFKKTAVELALLKQVNVSVVAWALLHDIELAEFDTNLNTVGLITKRGRKKPGHDGFKALKKRLR